MKNIKKMCLVLAYCSLTFVSFSQKMGGKVGLHLFNKEFSSISIPESANQVGLTISPTDFKMGGHFGLMGQFKFLKVIFIQPEVLFDFNEVDYDVLETGGATKKLKEVYTRVQIPVSLGIKIAALRAYGGGSARFHIGGRSDFTKTYSDYKQTFEQPSYAWHYGVGLDVGIFAIDLRHEKSLKNYASHFTFNDINYAFDKPENRYVLSLGILF